MNGKVLCLGRLYADLVFTGVPALPTLGTETFAGGLALHAGGGAAITAAYLAASGREVALAAHLPGAPFDDGILADLRGQGVDTTLLAADPVPRDPQVTVAIVAGGDRAFLTRATGAVAPEIDISALGARGFVHLHIGELRTLVDRPALLEQARSAGMTVSLDCGWDAGLDAGVAPLVAGVDLFLPNADESAYLTDLGLPVRPAPLTVVKRGDRGATAHDGGTPIDRAARSGPCRDPTGAGDAFNAGFLHRWLDGRPLPDCLEGGIECGAAAVAAVGGMTGTKAIRQSRTGLAAAQ
ncbi:PfkB family carbohydrate kinase [Jannaschia sp. S6380]|uniref:carbohydrate kinase family protein n=1 Tax=Jannaschia sp. S6380 TaxID=2926408 RepID=UPI001FF5FD09|nr:PfkB family carbohydrate kinase [Jannaschia sp. S6380]MCK0168340.1 PfkB family carbohydrate kinase [Jannaschia sp. S6380]